MLTTTASELEMYNFVKFSTTHLELQWTEWYDNEIMLHYILMP